MLTDLHDCIRELIHERGHIDPNEVDVTFEIPTREWIDKLVRPTVDLYLVELEENTELRKTQYQTKRANGNVEFRQPPRRIDLRYVVTALTTNADDSYRLLWRVLGVLMRTPELPPERLPENLKLQAPIIARIAQPDAGVNLLDAWSALGTEPRPSFRYVLTAPVDLEIGFDAPLILSRTMQFRPLDSDGPPESRTFVRGTVLDAAGTAASDVTVWIDGTPSLWTRTDASGAFNLKVPESGLVKLRLLRADGSAKRVSVEVPGPAIELHLD
jgi:Pvc16 N-terminal domain